MGRSVHSGVLEWPEKTAPLLYDETLLIEILVLFGTFRNHVTRSTLGVLCLTTLESESWINSLTNRTKAISLGFRRSSSVFYG